MDDVFEARRRKLQAAVQQAVLDLCGHMGCAGFSFEIPGTTPAVVVTVSEAAQTSAQTQPLGLAVDGGVGRLEPGRKGLSVRTTLVLLALAATMPGCDNSRSKADAVNTAIKACSGPVRMTVQVGGLVEFLRVECEVHRDAFAAPPK